MNLLHGAWIPNPGSDFVQTGVFYLWVETDKQANRPTAAGAPKKKEPKSKRAPEPEATGDQTHPRALKGAAFTEFIEETLGYKPLYRGQQTTDRIRQLRFLLPSQAGQPIMSPELLKFSDDEPPEAFTMQACTTAGFK